MRTVSLHNAKVKFILQNAQSIAVGIDDRNVVVFTYKVFRQRPADLSCAQNDNLHIS